MSSEVETSGTMSDFARHERVGIGGSANRLQTPLLHCRTPRSKGVPRERTQLPVASNWTPQGWTGFEGRHLPTYPDQAALDAVTARLGRFPPLVFAGEARALRADLAQVAAG